MYVPKYTITTEILRNIAAGEASREVIENAPLVPAWEAKFRDEALLKAAHYGTALEGNDLTLGEVKLIVEGGVESVSQAEDAGVVARERDVQEVINYRKVMGFLERLEGEGLPGDSGVFYYTRELLLEIQRLVLDRLVLFKEGYDIKRFFALEEYFDKHSDDYFGSLMEVSNQSFRLEDRDLTPWLATFTRALATELTRIKEKVRELSMDIKVKQKMGRQIALSERQMIIMEYLNSNGAITMAEARRVLPMVSEDTILREVGDLMKKRVVVKKGSTKAAKYVIKKKLK